MIKKILKTIKFDDPYRFGVRAAQLSKRTLDDSFRTDTVVCFQLIWCKGFSTLWALFRCILAGFYVSFKLR